MNQTSTQHKHDHRTCYARHITILGWFLGMIWLLGHNRYQSFIHPDFKILLLLAMNGTFVFLVAISSRATYEHLNCDHDHDHASRFKQWLNAGWVLLPLWFAIAGLGGQSLNADAFAKRRVTMPIEPVPIPAQDMVTLPLEEPHPILSPQKVAQTKEVTLLDIASSQDSMLGQTLRTIGRVYRGDDIPGGHIAIFRFAITCCAADAQPVGMLVQTDAQTLPQTDQWVEIQGKLELHPIDGRDQFVIVAISITTIDPPQSPYLQVQW